MVDLNLWKLEYEGTDFEFGTHDSGYPFTKQVTIGPAAMTTDDQQHPGGDATMFGIDRSGGRSIQFGGAYLDTLGWNHDDPRWKKPLDAAVAFHRAWNARAVRRVPGAVALLSNIDRERCVYGRPRSHSDDLTIARQGWATYACDFVTSDDKFYDLTEKMVTVGVVPTVVGGFTFPTTFPMSTFGMVSSAGPGMGVGGDDETWPVIVMNGPGLYPRVRIKTMDDETLIDLTYADSIEDGDVVIIDCRPWSRGVTLNGVPRNGRIRGTRLDECLLTPGDLLLTASGVFPAETSFAVWWRDAHSSL